MIVIFCLNCLHSFRTKDKLELHKHVNENIDFCNAKMPSEENKILNLVNAKNLIKHYLLFMQNMNVQQKRLVDVK